MTCGSLEVTCSQAWLLAVGLHLLGPLALGWAVGRGVRRWSRRSIAGVVGSLGIAVLPCAAMVGLSTGSLRIGLWDSVWVASIASLGIWVGGHAGADGLTLRKLMAGGALILALIVALWLASESRVLGGARCPGGPIANATAAADSPGTGPTAATIRTLFGPFLDPTCLRGQRSGKLAWLLRVSPPALPLRLMDCARTPTGEAPRGGSCGSDPSGADQP